MLAALNTDPPPSARATRDTARPTGPLACVRVGRVRLLCPAAATDTTCARDDELLVGVDGPLFNHAALCATLGIAGQTADAAVLIARAYRRWGDDCAAHLHGECAFVIWDARRRRLLAAGDALGVRLLHYARRGDTWAVASTAEQVLALLGEAPRLDRLALAAWLVGRPLPARAVLADVSVLPAGHVLTLAQGRLQTRPFWELDPHATLHYARAADYHEHLRDLLGRCVADRLAEAGGLTACQLSGGMDSSSIAALAAGLLDDPGERLLAVSHVYRAGARWDERGLIAQTATRLGLRRHLLLPAESYAGLAYPALYPPDLDSPGTVVSPRYLDELRLVRDQGARVLLTGSGGDEMTWGHSLSYGGRLRRGEFGVVAEVWRGARAHGLTPWRTLRELFVQPLLPEPLRRLHRRLQGRTPWPAWMPNRTALALDLEQRLFCAPRAHFADRARAARHAALTHSATFHAVRSYQAAGRRVGVDVRHPFFDRRVAEFSFAIPDDLWLRDGYPKWLVRKAMDGLLPDDVNWNRHKVVFDHYFAALIRDQRDTVRRVLSHPALQELGLVDNAALLAAFDAALDRDPPTVTVELLHALMAQIWVQRHLDALSLT